MRLLSPLALGTAAALTVSGPATAKKPRPAPAPAVTGATAPEATAPGASASPSAAPGGTHPAAPAPSASPPAAPGAARPEPSGAPVVPGDSAAAPADKGFVPDGVAPDGATSPGDVPAPAASAASAPVVPSASVRRRESLGASSKRAPESSDDDQVPPARDTVGGHFAVGVDVGVVLPFGNVASGTAQSRTMGAGLTLGGDIAYGVSRTVMLGVYADFGLPDPSGPAANKTVNTIAAGPLLRYHLVQGMRFDPWVSGGIGFRRTSIGDTSFTGIDWARLSLGGDFYPTSNVGFGPFLSLSLGTFFAESPGTLPTKALNAHFLAGLRVVFDGPGK